MSSIFDRVPCQIQIQFTFPPSIAVLWYPYTDYRLIDFIVTKKEDCVFRTTTFEVRQAQTSSWNTDNWRIDTYSVDHCKESRSRILEPFIFVAPFLFYIQLQKRVQAYKNFNFASSGMFASLSVIGSIIIVCVQVCVEFDPDERFYHQCKQD